MIAKTLRNRAARWENAPSRLVSISLVSAIVSSLSIALLVAHPALSPELMGPFTAAHGLLGSAIVAIAGYLAMLGVLWPLAQVMALVETVAKALGVAGFAAVLPFAQATDPAGSGVSKAKGEKVSAAAHEIQIGAYGGYNHTRPSEVRFVQPNDTNLTFEDVQWMGESLKTEPYWGVRVSYWSPKLRRLGFMFDYTHAKATAIKTQTLKQSGTRDGKPVPSQEPFEATFRKLEFTHGLNFFTLNALYRTRGLHNWIAPYLGIGIGLSVPHVDTNRAGAPDDARTYSHQITGLAFQGLGGIEWKLHRSGRISAFTEYKVTYTSNRGELNGGGWLDTDLWTHQVPVGFSYHHRLGGAR